MYTLPKDAKLLVIGSGPIVIGQAAEFDYAGTQACKALREEGYQVVLVNSNPATIMTDTDVADRVYIEPLTVATLTAIIEKERPQGLLATLGGQTALNLAVELSEAGVLERYGVQLLGTPLASIKQAEDRQLFKDLMEQLEQPIPESEIVHSLEEGLQFLEQIGLPVILRPAYTLGGTGGGIAETMEQAISILTRGLKQSPIGQVLVERSIRGWKEIEYEVMRDGNGTCITICNMENVDPVGVHTGDSIVVAPSQTLTDRNYQMLRTAALTIIRALKIEGGCNVQFALDPYSDRYCVIEVNSRVSRSSALASKATGYPIAKIAAKIAVGLQLDEIVNPVTGRTYAAFEPALDYLVVKVPRWPFDKFPQAARTLGTQMKATGEVMALGRNFEEALQKALRSLEIGVDGVYLAEVAAWSDEVLGAYLAAEPDDRRLFALAEALRRGVTVAQLQQGTQVDAWFLHKLAGLVELESQLKQMTLEEMTAEQLLLFKKKGFADTRIAALIGTQVKSMELQVEKSAEQQVAVALSEQQDTASAMTGLLQVSKTHPATAPTPQDVRAKRLAAGIKPIYTLVDTCAAEFESSTPYYFSTYVGEPEEPNSEPFSKKKAMVVGSGPIRIGQGIEFDYCSVHAVNALKRLGYETVILNNNPETVSTDFDTADSLYFEPLTAEDVLAVIEREGVELTFVQFGGQTAINLASQLAEAGVKIAGTSLAGIHAAEDREEFRQLLDRLAIPQSVGGTATDVTSALATAKRIGYPVMVRPSYVIGGQAMAVVYSDEELVRYMERATDVGQGHPILIDRYLAGKEVEVDAVCDGKNVLIPGLFEHIERAGVHSGDSMSVYPPQSLSEEEVRTIVSFTEKIALHVPVVGLLNIQFVIVDGQVYVLEVNPRASRTVPILSKVTGVPLVDLAVRVSCGEALAEAGYGIGLYPAKEYVVVKAPVFSFAKLTGLDIQLSPEMKSTGEVLGIGATYEEALAKAFVGAGIPVGASAGSFSTGLLVSITDRQKAEALPLLERFAALGMTLFATEGTARLLIEAGLHVHTVPRDEESTQSLLKSGAVQFVLNAPTLAQDPTRLGYQLRRFTVEMKLPCLTSLDTAAAWLQALEAKTKPIPMYLNV
ncbi:MAG TPA: carbamoyl-phosphate synthase large subunit [Bacilli bacterium]|nr:carbamoyl-phosphate synthase large subunit [Bacilli bacterium]